MAKITLSPEERAAKREYQRQYRLKNAEKLLTNRREWRKKNTLEIRMVRPLVEKGATTALPM